MIADRSPRLGWGLLALVIYMVSIILLAFYFNVKEEEKAKRYVKKNEQRIQVGLSSPKKAINPKSKSTTDTVVKPRTNKTSKTKKVIKPKAKPKSKPQTKPQKIEIKKVIKEKVVKKAAKKKELKKKDLKVTQPKKKPQDLFANVKTPKKNVIQVSDKPIESKPKRDLIKVTEKKSSASELINTSLKNQKSSDSGVEDAYLAKVQSMLEGWPAQNVYAGEKVKMHLLIDPAGAFEFRVMSASNNENFNRDLVEYLKQLQLIGFGRHKGSRTYKFEAEFIAKE